MERPDKHELIWLFEQEPKVQDPDSPLFYNTLGFEVVRDSERLVCTVSPSYGDVELHLTRDGEHAVDLSLGHVERLSVLKENQVAKRWCLTSGSKVSTNSGSG